MRSVDLHQAFLWTCEDCGRDNFERAVAVEPESREGRLFADLTDHAVDEVNEVLGERGASAGLCLVMAPEMVRCPHCGAEYESLDED